jgi:hypothetical protein
VKGVVFVEFLEFVEDRFSLEVVDRIITNSALASGGAYTSVGVYDHGEMLRLVRSLSDTAGTAAGELLRVFGQHLFTRFVAKFPGLFADVRSCTEFLATIEGHIHVEVRKLYPDAELPSFAYEEASEDELIMIYESPRCLGDFAMGLINGAIEHFDKPMSVTMTPLNDSGSRVRFSVTPC